MAEHTLDTCGMDIGDRYSLLCVMDEAGEIVEETRIPTTRNGLTRYFGSKTKMRVAIEVGTHSPWISRLLEEFGHEVLVANARKLRMIYESDDKNDRLDAQMLARVARFDPQLLSPIQHRGRESQSARALISSRDALVRARTRLINHVRGLVKSTGERMRSCSSERFHKLWMELPQTLESSLQPMMELIGQLTNQIADYDRQIEALSQESFPETMVLRQVAGVGPVTALSFVATIEEPQRFGSNRQVGAFLGLRPRRDQSGGRDPELRITKAGDPYLRRLLVGSAQYILGPFGPDSDLRRWGERLAARGGKAAKRRAAVAVARKLAVLLLALWKSGEDYEPLRSQSARSMGETECVAA